MPIPQVSPMSEMQEDLLLLAIVDQVVRVLDSAIMPHYDRDTDETFLECKMCGEWDSHLDACPVPALELWMNRDDLPARS